VARIDPDGLDIGKETVVSINAALEELKRSAQVEECKVKKNTARYDAYRLTEKGAGATGATL